MIKSYCNHINNLLLSINFKFLYLEKHIFASDINKLPTTTTKCGDIISVWIGAKLLVISPSYHLESDDGLV